MTELADKKCIPCEGGIPSFDLEEIHKYLKKVDGWDVQSLDNKDYYIIKNFKFNNFLESQSFVNKVGEIAEQEGHHPDIWFGWGYAKIKYKHMLLVDYMRVILFLQQKLTELTNFLMFKMSGF